MYLAKKLGIELPGQSRIRSLHQHNLKSLYAPTSSQGATASTTKAHTTVSVDTKKQGTKRKMNA